MSNANETTISITYGALVWQQFKHNRLAVFGLVLIGLLVFVGTFAPFLAADRPLVVRVAPERTTPLYTYQGQSKVVRTGWSSPVMENLTNADIVFLILFAWVAGQLVIRRLTVYADNPTRRAIRLSRPVRKSILWGITIITLTAALLVMGMRLERLPDKLTDWQKIIKNAEAGDWFLMPPIAHRPYKQELCEEPLKPTWWGDSDEGPGAGLDRPYHLLGTDQMGRDVASQLTHGARLSMGIGLVSVGISVTIGTIIGALAGYFRGKVDFWIMRFIELMMCFPTIFLILTISVMVTERSVWHVMVIIGVTRWTGSARLIRGEFFKQRAMEYVSAARAVGGGPMRVMFRHILPNAMAPLLVGATFGIAGSILLESVLSFLNIGVPENVATWGRTLSYGVQYVRYAWWLIMFPGLAIFITVTAYNLAGEGLRDAIDPRMRI